MQLSNSIYLVISLVVAAYAVDLTPSTIIPELRVVYKTYKQCEEQGNVIGCLKLRALRLLERAIAMENIPLIEGVSMKKGPVSESERSLNQIEVEENLLPSENRLDSLIWSNLFSFFKTHSLEIQMPKLLSASKQLFEQEIEDGEQGRGKKKKYMGPLLVGLMMKGTLVAMAFKGLALLAGKALLVSKLALVLAGIIALKKLFSGGGNEKTTYEIVKQPVVTHAHQYSSSHEYSPHEYGGSGGGYARSIQENVPYPHLLAYRGQIEQNTTQSSKTN